jgi:hypothetical protein
MRGTGCVCDWARTALVGSSTGAVALARPRRGVCGCGWVGGWVWVHDAIPALGCKPWAASDPVGCNCPDGQLTHALRSCACCRGGGRIIGHERRAQGAVVGPHFQTAGVRRRVPVGRGHASVGEGAAHPCVLLRLWCGRGSKQREADKGPSLEDNLGEDQVR